MNIMSKIGMSKLSGLSYPAAACLLCFALSACSPITESIFYSLEREVKISKDDKGIPKTAPMSTVYEYGSYFLAKGTRLYIAEKPAAGDFPPSDDEPLITAWEQVKAPKGDNNLSLVDTGVSGSDVYALFVENAPSSNDGIYMATSITTSNADSVTWTAISLSGIDDNEQVIGLFVINGTVVVQTIDTEEKTYSLKRRDGSVFVSLPFNGGVTEAQRSDYLPFITAEFDGTEAILLKRNSVFSSDLTTDINRVTLTGLTYPSGVTSHDPGFTGLFVASATDFYVVSEKGYAVFYDGANAEASSSIYGPNDDEVYEMTSIAYITLEDASGDTDLNVLLAGTESDGLVVIDTSDLSIGNFKSETGILGNYSSTRIANGAVANISISAAERQFFVGTPSVGLWSGYYESDAATPGIIWSWE